MKRTWIDHRCALHADVSTASDLLRNVDGWPEFTPGLDAIERETTGPVEVGSHFRMRLKMVGAPRLTLPAEVFEWSPRRLEWGGGMGSSTIRHIMELRETGPATCELRHLEYVSGWLTLSCFPWEGVFRRHDRRWSDAIQARFQ